MFIGKVSQCLKLPGKGRSRSEGTWQMSEQGELLLTAGAQGRVRGASHRSLDLGVCVKPYCVEFYYRSGIKDSLPRVTPLMNPLERHLNVKTVFIS